MMPDHARALRTSAVLAILAALPPFFGSLAMLHMGSYVMAAALFLSFLAIIGIAFRASVAFDRLRQRHLHRALAPALMIACALGPYAA